MNSPQRLFPELAGFAVLLAAAWFARWTPGELAWGLWVSGFVLIALWLLIMAGWSVKQDGPGWLKTAGLLLATGLMGWALVWVYRFYGDLLDLGFPLVADPGRVYEGGATWRNVRPFEFWPTLAAAARQFGVVIAVSLVPLLRGLVRSWPDAAQFRRDPGLSGAAFARLHLTVMTLIALQIVFRDAPDRHAFVFSAAILAINYFPWSLFAESERRIGPRAGARR